MSSPFQQWHTPSNYQKNKAQSNVSQAQRAEEELADLVFGFHADPLKFVLAAYPWGEEGPLAKYDGPDTWQREFLIELGEAIKKRAFNGTDAVDPIYMTRASGHGIGKGTLTAFLVDFLMSTRVNAIGTVTANSYPQLETKTWASIQKWTKLCFTSHWFEITGDRMWKTDFREQWFTAALSCAPENAQSFAGQHNATSTSFYIFDEGSDVPDIIYEKADGGLTDGEPMLFVFGNPTRRQGKFYRINFDLERDQWNHKSIDSRTCRFTNKSLLAKWERLWGEDSERFRVQVKGLPPMASDLQYISSQTVSDAQKRKAVVLRNDPLICGLDVSRGGADNCVFRFRRGKDAQSIPPIRISGEDARDSTVLENKALDILKNGVLLPKSVDYVPFGTLQPTDSERRMPISMLFIDGTGVGGPVCDHLKALGFDKRITEIQFAWESPNTSGIEECANMRSWMWALMKNWLEKGGCIDSSTDLESDLTRPMYHYNAKNQLVLESKEAMKKRCGTIEHSGSPDDGDSLALTFARPVAPLKRNIVEDDPDWDDDVNPENMGFAATGGGRVWG